MKEFDLPDGVVLVDTPGLDDAVEYRSDITREYIDRANAVLVCVKSDALTGAEFATICSVFANTRYNPEGCLIEAEVYGNGIIMWLLSQGAQIEVMEPESLRKKMKDTIKKMAEKYQ